MSRIMLASDGAAIDAKMAAITITIINSTSVTPVFLRLVQVRCMISFPMGLRRLKYQQKHWQFPSHPDTRHVFWNQRHPSGTNGAPLGTSGEYPRTPYQGCTIKMPVLWAAGIRCSQKYPPARAHSRHPIVSAALSHPAPELPVRKRPQ